ncbi:MAG: hypothetical protein ACI9S8_000597 [Chlamydiales bacterium]|jgi:hypothetical protein
MGVETNNRGTITEGTKFLLTNGDGLTKAIVRAWSDKAYKARLFSNARAALAELEINLPKEINFRILEEKTADTLTFILPQAPDESTSLTQEELEKAAKETVMFLSTINAISTR